MKNKIFKLVNKETGLKELEFEINEMGNHYIGGTLRNVELYPCDYPDENLFIANVYIKWDGCSDIRFLGREYENTTENPEQDTTGYYHLCGGKDYVKMMRGMAFIAEVALMEIPKVDVELTDFEDIKKLNILENYNIEL